MKPAAFEYDAPRTVDEALRALATHHEDAKVLAGGQSLVPVLNFRLSRPARLIDINRVEELSYLRRDDGVLRIGALTRHARLERSAMVANGWPVLSQAVRLVAHGAIRNRGTVGGSVCHADPAAELPVALAALDARFHVRSERGARTVGAPEFFVDHMTTSLEDDELLTEVEVPPLPELSGSAFVEFARRDGDFALAGAATVVTLDAGGRCTSAAIALLGAAPTPLRAPAAEAALAGLRLDETTTARIARDIAASVRPTGDIHGSSDYRRGLIASVVRRALLASARQATPERA